MAHALCSALYIILNCTYIYLTSVHYLLQRNLAYNTLYCNITSNGSDIARLIQACISLRLFNIRTYKVIHNLCTSTQACSYIRHVLSLLALLDRTVAGIWLELDTVRAFGGKRRGGEEWEGLHCWQTEREKENQYLATAC